MQNLTKREIVQRIYQDKEECRRGDIVAIRSAGAYGEVMASGYNCRPLPKGYISEEMR